jgi:hypothetical protein
VPAALGKGLVFDLYRISASALERAQAFVANFAKDGERNLPLTLEYIGRMNTGEIAKRVSDATAGT